MRQLLRSSGDLALCAFGIAICLHYGRRGFLALDASIVFDGGWRVLSGDWPFAGFVAPAGAVPSIMQAAWFGAAGVSWFVYCLHAAAMNGLFAVVVSALLRAYGAPAHAAWVFGLLSAVVFYPPFGVPYPDQHSFFFSLLCVLATRKGTIDHRGAAGWIAVAPACAMAAWFSKPIPAALILPWCGWVLARHLVSRRAATWRPLAAGSAAVLAAAAVYAVVQRVDAGRAIYYGVVLPFWTGITRAPLDARLRGVLAEFRDGMVLLTPVITVGCAVAALVWARRSAGAAPEARQIATTSFTAVGGLGVCLAFIVLTNNDAMNGVPLLFLSVGLAWLALDQALQRAGGRPATATFRATLLGLVVAVSVVDAARFNTAVNARRIVHDQVWNDRARPVSPGGRLAFLAMNDAWFGAHNLAEIVRFIDGYGENFLLFGDSSVIYGATGRPSIFPALWFHPSLTIPPTNSPEFARFEGDLVARMRRHRVRYVIQEGYATRMGAALDDFSAVANLVRGCREAAVGSWRLLEICR